MVRLSLARGLLSTWKKRQEEKEAAFQQWVAESRALEQHWIDSAAKLLYAAWLKLPKEEQDLRARISRLLRKNAKQDSIFGGRAGPSWVRREKKT